MKNYYVIYKKYQQPGVSHLVVEAMNKHEAKLKFMESRIKYDYIIEVII